MSDASPTRHVRVRTAERRAKALAQLAELRNTGQVARALVIVETKGGDYEVLAQEMAPNEIPPILYATTRALMEIEKRQGGLAGPTPEAAEPEAPEPVVGGYPGEPNGRLNAEWRSFAEVVLPTAAGMHQRQEMRRAFYAGAQGLFSAIMGGLDPGTDATDADLDRMERLKDELVAFAKAVGEGRA